MPALLEELVLVPVLELVPVLGLGLAVSLGLFELGYVELLLEFG